MKGTCACYVKGTVVHGFVPRLVNKGVREALQITHRRSFCVCAELEGRSVAGMSSLYDL